MAPTNNIGYLLQHLSGVLAKQSDQALQERLGIGFSQYKILMVLEDTPFIKQKQISEQLGQTEASISRQIKLMLGKGLLQTRINPSNRRERITVPTPKGLRLKHAAQDVLNSHHAPTFASLDSKQFSHLHEALTRLHHHTCQSGKTGACDHPFEV
jgi:DNA-binding MarR family transcriptional regulator